MTSRWLRLLRIHTAALAQGLVLVGLGLSGARDWTTWLLFALLAVAYHAAGFVHNDICDVEHDKSDPAKSHFPLVSGEVSLRDARLLYAGLLVTVLVLASYLSRGRAAPLLCLAGAVVAGHVYNFRAKSDPASAAYAAVAFTCLPLAAYYAHADRCSVLMVLVAAYVALMMVFEIGVEGCMKDIDSDEVSLLRALGCCLLEGGNVRVSGAARAFSWLLKAPAFALFVVMWRESGSHIAALVAGLHLAGVVVWATRRLLADGAFERQRRIRMCVIIEVLTYTMLVLAVQGSLGWGRVVLLIAYPYAWYVVLNRLTWATTITPRV